MTSCTICSSVINADGQYYVFNNMGPDLLCILENNLGHEVDGNSGICEQCFTNAIQTMSSPALLSCQGQEHNKSACVWCRRSLFKRRSHSLPEGHERRVISERISPRTIPAGSLVCYACWVRAHSIQEYQNVDVTPEASSSLPDNTNICVQCFCSLNLRRSHSLPEGPERTVIASRIYPRQIPPHGCVCHACWMAAYRNSQRTHVDETHQGEVAAFLHLNDFCVVCESSLFRRQVRILHIGPERDAVQARIFPREVPEHALICTHCWIQTTEYVQNIEHSVAQTLPTMKLDIFEHTTSSSSSCFVPNCRNTERLSVPNYLRKQILTSKKVFVMDNARICAEHKTIYNWDFLDQYEFSKEFTKSEMQSMLNLSLTEISHNFDFENIETMDDSLFIYWTGLTKEKYRIIFNIVKSDLTCKAPYTALGAYLMKIRTGDSHQRISSLLCRSKSSITRLLDTARKALLHLFVPLHLGINHVSRHDIINRNLLIPEGLFGNREERVPIVICDGTYIYLQKSSNYLFQKKTYSLHKYRNLVKPFLLVATDGYIIDILGPYPAIESDADIMKALFQDENGAYRQFFRENDVFILDRGFRDAVPFLNSLGYKLYQPESLQEGETQLPTIRANKSRCVTMCRWVVEVVNGRIKRDFKLYRQEYFNVSATHLMDDIRICASLINAFHPLITNRPDAEIILNRALQRKEMPNILAELVISNRINRFRAQFSNINAQLPELDIFPEMTVSDLIIFGLGTYQIKQAKCYYGEHIRQRGSFQVEISDQLEVLAHATLSQHDPVLIRGRIKSRHQSGKTYYTYILMARQGINWNEKIISYFCNCIAGQRTMGCCAHIMTVIWYLGWARHQVNTILAPASFLDGVLIRDDL